MGAEGSASVTDNRYPRSAEHLREDGGSMSRRWKTRGASQVGAAAFFQVFQCLVRQGIEAPGFDVVLKLSIPQFGVERSKPSPKRCELLRGQLSDRLFDFWNATHVKSLSLSFSGSNHLLA